MDGGTAQKTSSRSNRSESPSLVLPNEVMVMIFRFLTLKELLIAEQVCPLWKDLVDVCLGTATRLATNEFYEETRVSLKLLNRFGPSLKYLKLFFCVENSSRIDWIKEIGDAFPNLQTIVLADVPIWSESFRVLPIKCSRLTKISLNCTDCTDEDLGIVLKGFPGLKHLKLNCHNVVLGECFRHLGPNLECLKLSDLQITPAGYSLLFSRCQNLQTLEIGTHFSCDALNFSNFCNQSTLRKLTIFDQNWSKETFFSISNLSLLEHLHIVGCPAVDCDVLFAISVGCPNLKIVNLSRVPQVSDRGVKALAECTHLTHLSLVCIPNVTDESLFAFAQAGILESLGMVSCTGITDQGVSAIQAQCPRLVHLNDSKYKALFHGHITVDENVEIRQYLVRVRLISHLISQRQIPDRDNAIVKTWLPVFLGCFFLCVIIIIIIIIFA